jgi:hypothetical protein
VFFLGQRVDLFFSSTKRELTLSFIYIYIYIYIYKKTGRSIRE